MKPVRVLSLLPWVEGTDDGGVLRWDGLTIIASWGGGWDHVSVSKAGDVCPTWDEMCVVKDLFFDPEECVIQYHPPASVYRRETQGRKGILHMWKKQGSDFELPPKEMI